MSLLATVLALPALPAGCDSTSTEPGPRAMRPAERPPIVPYRPLPNEEYPNGKRIAARIAQRALTYAQGANPAAIARSLGPSTVGAQAMARVLRPGVKPGVRSSAEVTYAQLSGLTATSLGAMVVVRQRLQDGKGRTRSVSRVVDVRLRRSDGPWSLDRIGSLGGAPPGEASRLSAAARQALDAPNLELPDSARWDIYRGAVDPALLDVLVMASRDRRLAVTVIDSGHPRNVWATSRPSAHSSGFAVDIWAVDGVPVIRQREPGSAAYEFVASLVAGGAYQVGSPWIIGGGSQSFSDAVHQDHIHLQQSPVG